MGIFDYLIMDARVSGLADRLAHVHETSQGRIEADIESLRAEQAALRRDVEQLALYTRAVVSLLVDRQVFDEDELIECMVQLDESDGERDGRLG